jgi:dTDP-4-dehydrorhamnose reductase
MTKILVTGVTGQVGQELQQTLVPLGEIVSLSRQQLDLTQPELIRETIEQIKPDIIINSGAYTAVDKAETESELATAINGNAPKILAEAARAIDAKIIHISTDYVFNGQNYRPYTELDSTDPVGIYGRSKLLGEIGVRENCDRHIILRTAWVYGCRGHGNFVKTMLRLGTEKPELRVVADQIGSPTWAYDIAMVIAQLVRDIDKDLSWGTYHYTSSGVASWYDFAIAIFTEAKQLGFPLAIQKVIPITTAEYPTPAQRPLYSVLSKAKIAELIGNTPPHWRESLRQMLAEYRSLDRL